MIKSNIFILALFFALTACYAGKQKQKSDKPNIILIMSDDMGYSDIGCYGEVINTPTLDGLAKGGLRFTQFYNGARCCSTRASLITGLYAHQEDFMTVWGYKLPAGYMMSTGEAGIRAYNTGETIIDGKLYKRGTSNPTILNCTIKYMRTGVTIAHATGKKYVEGCVVIGCENGFSLGSGDVVNCSADCAFGPVYSSSYETDKNYNADITILPASNPYFNGSGSVAYVGGSGHNITLRGTGEVVKEGLRIKVGGEKNNIRLLCGNFPHQNDFKASNFELNNLTDYPFFLSDKSSGVKVQSVGKVTDLGIGNQVTQIKVSKKK